MAKSVRRISFNDRSMSVRDRFRDFLEPTHDDVAYQPARDEEKMKAFNYENYIHEVQERLEREVLIFAEEEAKKQLYFYHNAKPEKPLLEI